MERLAQRRLDRTGWLRFDELDEEQTLLAAVAEVHPARVLDVGCGDGLASLIAAPEVACVDSSPAAVEAAAAVGDIDEVLGEFVRVLRPGGRFVELYGQILAPDGPHPFTATRRKCVFVADAA